MHTFYYKKNQKYHNGPPNDYFDGMHFKRLNPLLTKQPSQGRDSTLNTLGFMMKLIKSRKAYLYKPEDIKVEPQNATPKLRVNDQILVYFILHASLLIQMGGINIITDPIYSKKAGPLGFLGPKRLYDPGISFDNLPPIDVVLISHNHYDHMDISTIKKLKNKFNPLFITPVGNDFILKNLVKGINVHPLIWEEEFTYKSSIKLTLEKSYHWSRRGLYDRNKALWGSFVMQYKDKKLYFAADTAFHDGKIFHELKQKYESFDLSMIPIGAYEPRDFMKSSHTNPSEAVEIHQIINSQQSMAIHFGTFQLSQEKYLQPQEDLQKALIKKQIPNNKFLALQPGQYLTA